MSVDVLDRLGIDLPVVQAGMGGGVAGAALAGAVSAAGGLGTVGTLTPGRFAQQIRSAMERAQGRPVAANLLMPYVEAGHVADVLAARPAVVVLFYGRDRHLVERLTAAGIVVLQQIGTVEQARAALSDGCDGFIAQGREAGGHLLGTMPTAEAVARAADMAGGALVLGAGGVATRDDVDALLDAGAGAAVAGTRFLLSQESRAHPGYQRRVLDATETVETQLFGLGWRARHRVVPNAAVRRWTGSPGRELLPHLVNRGTAPVVRRLSSSLGPRLLTAARPSLPLFSPQPPLTGMPDSTLESAALYAGESALRMAEVLPAAKIVGLLAGRESR